MRIGFDARMIDHPGIGRYIANLLPALMALNEDLQFTLYGDPDKLNDITNCKKIRYTRPIYNPGELFFSPFKDNDLDAVHIPHFNVPFNDIRNLVVTIHDLIYLKLPGAVSFFKKRAARPLLRNALKRADKIIAVSENTKKDIIENFPFAEEKIRVVYEAADPMFKRIDEEAILADARARYRLPENIILFVGSLKRHKNIERLIDAYTALKAKKVKHRLVIIGRYRPNEPEILRKIRTTDAIYLGEIPGDDLVALYNLSSVLIAPSLYEGFGLPVLEAMSCGLAVICSSSTSLPEVVGDAGIMFDPLDADDMAHKIYEVINNDDIRQGLIRKGLERIRNFSWEKTAKQTLQVYKELV